MITAIQTTVSMVGVRTDTAEQAEAATRHLSKLGYSVEPARCYEASDRRCWAVNAVKSLTEEIVL